MPLAAAVTLLLIRRGKSSRIAARDWLRAGLLFSASLGLWLAVRVLFYHGFSEAYPMYGLGRPWALAVSTANGLLHWPLGILPEGADIVGSVRSLLAGGDLRSAAVVLAVAANLAVLAMSACLIFHLRNREIREKYHRELLLLPWFLCSLAVVVTLSLSARMGCFVYTFGVPLLVSVSWRAERSITRILGRAILLVSAVIGGLFLVRDLGPETRRQHEYAHVIRELVTALKASNGHYDRVYLLNDAVASCSTRWLKEFVDIRPDLVAIGGLDALPEANDSVSTEITRQGDVCHASVRLHGHCKFVLRGSTQVGLSEEHPVIRPNQRIEYEFPQFKKIDSRTKTHVYSDLGRVMNVRLQDDCRYGILFYDSALHRYTME